MPAGLATDVNWGLTVPPGQAFSSIEKSPYQMECWGQQGRMFGRSFANVKSYAEQPFLSDCSEGFRFRRKVWMSEQVQKNDHCENRKREHRATAPSSNPTVRRDLPTADSCSGKILDDSLP